MFKLFQNFQMDFEIINDDSIVNVISNLSAQLTQRRKSSSRGYEYDRKEFFKIVFEILLDKRHSDVYDRRSDYSLDELLVEMFCSISCRNKSFMNKHIRKRISALIDRLGELARMDSEMLSLVKSCLRMILILNDFLPSRKLKGILKYMEPRWFAKRPAEWCFYRQSSQPSNLNIQSMMCIQESYESPFFATVKMKKSATWHEGVMNALTSNTTPSPSIARPISQTLISLDEGFVTPDDVHREITPEPDKARQLDPGWWCTWDVVSSPPSEYKTFESQWVLPVYRETQDLTTIIESSYKALRVDSILMGAPVPPDLTNFIPADQLRKDIMCLLCGLPSSTFLLTCNNTFKVTEGSYTTGVMPNQFIKLTAPFITFAETYLNIESYINNNKKFVQVVPQALSQSLDHYLFQLKSLIINEDRSKSFSDGFMNLTLLISKPSAHMKFLWRLIESENSALCHRVLERMNSSLPFIHDQELLCIINVILLKCCYIYIDFFEKLINTGVCAKELICESTGSLSVEKVPSFLRPLADIIKNSTKTLQLLHQDPKMLMLKSKVLLKKPENPTTFPVDPQELVKQHYVKYMKEKEEERARLYEKKAKQMSTIMEDIAVKRKWKELEEMQLEMRERQIMDRFEKMDSLKEKYLDECRKDVEAKYESLIRESDKKIAMANWKMRRLASESERSEFIKSAECEELSVRQDFMDRGLDLSEENKELIVSPVEVTNIEIKKREVELPEETKEVFSRHDEAAEIKKKLIEGTGDWKCSEPFDDQSKDVDKVDIVDGLSLYEENRSKALAIKEKVMSSELKMESLLSPTHSEYKGLSQTERDYLEDNLTVFSFENLEPQSSYFKASENFLKQKSQVRDYIQANENKFHSGVLNFIEMKHIFLKSAEAYLKKEIEVANRMILEQVKNDFVKEVRWIIDHYLLLDALWAHSVAKGIVDLMRQGTLTPVALNRLLPSPLAIRTNRQPPPAYDPSDPSSINFISLFYWPSKPLDHFITERFILKYNQNFLFLIKIEQACWLCKDAVTTLRIKPVARSSSQNLQYNQIHFHIHVMNHFIISAKSFIFNSFENCWEKFSCASEKVKSLDDLHARHIVFLKSTQYFCMQTKRASNLRDTVLKMVSCIFKYCEILRCGILSQNGEGELVHSLFMGLDQCFKQFLSYAHYFYTYLSRLAETGRADALRDLLEMLSVNDFYSTLGS